MSTASQASKGAIGGVTPSRWARRVRAATATAIALTFGFQNFAWAVCSDGSTFPNGGYVVGQAPIVNPANFSPNIFTGTAGSQFVYDTSTNEFNDPTLPATFGGHEWVNDQGSTLCKETFVVGADGSTNWSIPPNTPTECVVYPNIVNGRFVNVGSIPNITATITPTCDPTKLSQPGLPNPANTYFNQLGCAISAFNNGGVVVATDAHTASSFLVGAGGQRSG